MENNKKKVEGIDAALKEYLAGDTPPELWDAMRYSVFTGGKRLRPQLLLATCTGLGSDVNTAMPFACSIEMIHTYSLIHDDLPAMDNDEMRRGNPTCHIKYGEAMAILAGDALLNLAFETMSNACKEHPEHIEAMTTISRASGANGMIAGQTVDILSENKSIDECALCYIHANKTAALFKASLEVGGILGGASDSQRSCLSEIGDSLGRAFQIRDDLQDITLSTEEMGKPAMSDIKNNKVTYVSLYGREQALVDCNALTGKARELIQNLQLKNTDLLSLTEFFCV